MPQSTAMVCSRCQREQHSITESERWASVYINGRVAADVCPQCLLADERATAEWNAAYRPRPRKMTEGRLLGADEFSEVWQSAADNGWLVPRQAVLDSYLEDAGRDDQLLILAVMHTEEPRGLVGAFPCRSSTLTFASMHEGTRYPIFSPLGFDRPRVLLELSLLQWMSARHALINDNGALQDRVRLATRQALDTCARARKT